MIDRIFSAALTFCLLAGGTVAIGSAMLEGSQRSAQPAVTVQLPMVTVVGKREAAAGPWAQSDAVEPASVKVQ